MKKKPLLYMVFLAGLLLLVLWDCRKELVATDHVYDIDGNIYHAVVIGGQMKEAGTTHWMSPNTGATNSSGFTALPDGMRRGPWGASITQVFDYYGFRIYCFWWSKSSSGKYGYLYLSNSGSNVKVKNNKI
jgi:hypothetical protein